MSRRTLAKLGLLGALYFAQGLPYGFFATVVPVELRERGASLTAVGLSALLAAPWALKWVWAPALDRVWWHRLGRRRTWILAMQLAAMIVLGAVALGGRASVPVLLGATFVLNLIAATQDIATDGLGVELLEDHERGHANGLQVGAYRFGMVIGGGVLLLYSKPLGDRGMFAVMAALVLLATVPVALAAEPPLPAQPPPDAVGARHFLKRPGVWRLLALLLIYKAGESFASGMQKPFLVDHGLDREAIGLLTGTVGSTAGIAGALLGGALVGPLGRRRSLVLFGLTQALAVAGYIYLAATPPNTAALYAVCSLETLASGAATAVLFTCMMDWSERFSSGTDYTVQASTVVIAQGVFGALSGASADALGYTAHFGVATGLCVAAIALAYMLFPATLPS